jgi:hypothetical protein
LTRFRAVAGCFLAGADRFWLAAARFLLPVAALADRLAAGRRRTAARLRALEVCAFFVRFAPLLLEAFRLPPAAVRRAAAAFRLAIAKSFPLTLTVTGK